MPIPLFIGMWEAIIILLVVLVLFGGSRLAGLGKGVGRSIREFKNEVTGDDKQVTEKAADDVEAKEASSTENEPRA